MQQEMAAQAAPNTRGHTSVQSFVPAVRQKKGRPGVLREQKHLSAH